MSQKNRNLPQDPLEFLKTFAGKKVHIFMGGKFGDATLKRGELVDYDIYTALMIADCKVEVDESGHVFLRCPRHRVEVFKAFWVKINGVTIESQESENK
jgi:small nuclear ribonucleoprotein (snRNP)-like protein